MPRRRPLADRLWDKVERGDGCWLWTGALDGSGYGQFSPTTGRMARAHRVVYELLVGPIPDGMTLDHLCRVRRCVNPAHLEPVTNRENILRGESFAARYARRDRCGRGHAYTSENTSPIRRHGKVVGRGCRACHRMDQSRYYRARKAAAA